MKKIKKHKQHFYKLILSLLFLFFILNIYTQNRAKDSILTLIKSTNNDSLKVNYYNKLRKILLYSELEEAKKYTQQMLFYASKRKDSFYIALANYYLGNTNVMSGDFVKALPYYIKSADYFENRKDFHRLSACYNGIATAYENNGKDSLSLKYFKKSYEINKKIKHSKGMGIALNNIGNIYRNRGEIKKAILYMEKAVVNFNNPILTDYKNTSSLNLASAYAENKELKKAEKIYKNIIPNIDTIKNVYNYAIALKGLGNMYMLQNNNKKALYYTEKAFNKFSKHNFKDERYKIINNLINIYYKNKKYKKATDLYSEFNTIKDSIFNDTKDKNLTNAFQKYESEKKEREIAQQQLIIEQKNQQKNKILIGLIISGLAIIAVFIFFKKRIKYQKTITKQTEAIQKQKITELKQKNKLLALNSMIKGQEAERLRIAKDLHDSLGGLLSTIKAHFSAIQKEKIQSESKNLIKKTNNLIDEACLEVSRISHNMIPQALSISGLQGAIEDLVEQLNEQGFEVTLEIKNIPKNIDETKKVMLYRLIQEIISNIRKHANAKTILIQLLGHKKEINLIIEDDGTGFDYNKALAKKGQGIKNINSRVEFLDGTIFWDSQQNEGTTITINIPVV